MDGTDEGTFLGFFPFVLRDFCTPKSLSSDTQRGCGRLWQLGYISGNYVILKGSTKPILVPGNGLAVAY